MANGHSHVSDLKPLDIPEIATPWWAPRGHLQTLAGHFIPSPRRHYGEEHVVELKDGDRLLIYVTKGAKPVVLSQFHGLGGDMTADYMRRGARIAEKFGFTHVYVNHRSAGPGLSLAKASYHSGRAEDASAVFEYLRGIFPNQKQLTIGYSMSANILLLLLSGQGGAHLPDGAIAINGPIDLSRASDLLRRGANRMYEMRFVDLLKKVIKKKQKLGLIQEKYRIPFGSSIWDFDEIFTAKASGFKSRDDYYETCSSHKHVHAIRTPTYVLSSADDPFVDVEAYYKAPWSRQVHLTISSLGGHLGYFDRRVLPLGSRRWLDVYIESALRNLLEISSLPR